MQGWKWGPWGLDLCTHRAHPHARSTGPSPTHSACPVPKPLRPRTSPTRTRSGLLLPRGASADEAGLDSVTGGAHHNAPQHRVEGACGGLPCDASNEGHGAVRPEAATAWASFRYSSETHTGCSPARAPCHPRPHPRRRHRSRSSCPQACAPQHPGSQCTLRTPGNGWGTGQQCVQRPPKQPTLPRPHCHPTYEGAGPTIGEPQCILAPSWVLTRDLNP